MGGSEVRRGHRSKDKQGKAMVGRSGGVEPSQARGYIGGMRVYPSMHYGL